MANKIKNQSSLVFGLAKKKPIKDEDGYSLLGDPIMAANRLAKVAVQEPSGKKVYLYLKKSNKCWELGPVAGEYYERKQSKSSKVRKTGKNKAGTGGSKVGKPGSSSGPDGTTEGTSSGESEAGKD